MVAQWNDLADAVQINIMQYWSFYVTCVLACTCKATKLVADDFKTSEHFRDCFQKALALTQPPFNMSKVDLFRSSIMHKGCLSGTFFVEERGCWGGHPCDLRAVLARLRKALLVGALPNLEVFDFHGDEYFNTDCMTLFTEMCIDGTLTHLKEVILDWTNRFNESVYLSISKAISNGVLPSLEILVLDVPIPKGASKVLRPVCKEHGIEIFGDRYKRADWIKGDCRTLSKYCEWVKEGRGCNAFTGSPFDYSTIDARVLARLNDMAVSDLHALLTKCFGYQINDAWRSDETFSVTQQGTTYSLGLDTEKRRLATIVTMADLESFSSSS